MTDTDTIRQNVETALRDVQDPELPVNVVDLGLIYAIDVHDGGAVAVRMTLTTPNCPVAESMPGAVRQRVESADGVTSVSVDLVWDPPWTSDMMSEDAKLLLEMQGIEWSDPHKGGMTSLTVDRKKKP